MNLCNEIVFFYSYFKSDKYVLINMIIITCIVTEFNLDIKRKNRKDKKN